MKKIGILLPAVNDALEYELPRAAPMGVSFHFSRFNFAGATRENYENIAADVPRSASLLIPLKPEAAFFACTSGSLYGGLGFDRKISDMVSEVLGCPASTTSSAVIEAFQKLGARRVTVLTPYPRWVDELEKSFFEGHGVAVDDIRGLGLTNCSAVTASELLDLADSLGAIQSDLVFISCTGLKTLALLPELRTRLQVPVLSSNSVTLWKLGQMLNLPEAETLLLPSL